MAHYAVIDTETTGFGRHDRVIEVAVVVLDSRTLKPIDEFDTLVNPQRDVGRTDIHGITASMVRSAPTFEEVINGLSARLHGAVMVGHNLAFDMRMIRREFERLDASFEEGDGCCTLALTGSKLDRAAAELDISLENHHRALCDARATAEVFQHLFDEVGATAPASVTVPPSTGFHRTLRREAAGWIPSMPILRKLLRRACYPSTNYRCAAYFDMLDWSLADGVISDAEAVALANARQELSIPDNEIAAMHEAYLQSLLASIHRDGVVTREEVDLFGRIAAGLGFPGRQIEETPPKQTSKMALLRPGICVCFTGSAYDEDGKPIERAELERLAAACGLQPVARVTKKLCQLLVAQDADTQSGKGKIAAKHGIPVMSVSGFLRLARR